MNRIKKIITSVSLICCTLIFLVGCTNSTDKKEESNKSLTLDFVQTNRHDDSVNKFSMTYDTKPTRALSITNAMIEMMLSLDLQKDMAGTAYAEVLVFLIFRKRGQFCKGEKERFYGDTIMAGNSESL